MTMKYYNVKWNFTNAVFVMILSLVLAATVTQPLAAKTDGFEVIYLGTEVSDNQPLNTYLVKCTPHDSKATITVEITFASGLKEHRSGLYCGAKFYVAGSVETVEVIAAIASPDVPEHSHKVWLPLVTQEDRNTPQTGCEFNEESTGDGDFYIYLVATKTVPGKTLYTYWYESNASYSVSMPFVVGETRYMTRQSRIKNSEVSGGVWVNGTPDSGDFQAYCKLIVRPS